MKKAVIITIAMHLAFVASAQFGINLGVNSLRFMGDVGKKSNTNFFSDACLGYNFGLDYRAGKIFGVTLNGLYGQLQGTDNDRTSKLNFQTKTMGGELNFTAFFDKIGSRERESAPFISAGVGYLMFDPHGDLMGVDDNGNLHKMHYWTDGSIKNMPQSTVNDPTAKNLKRDYVYETKLTDSSSNYARNCLYIPLTIGAVYKINYRFSIRISVNYNIALSDYIDNYKSGGNDSWLGANGSFNINFGKKPSTPYDDVDFRAIDNEDRDGDGISDLFDNCQGTPKGVVVDAKGCPIDTDDDGVPDYLDKEPDSPKGAKTDGRGVTINEEDYAKKQLLWDSLASTRSEKFNEAPSMNYLKKIEKEGKEIKDKSGKKTAIPDELKAADLNKDGFISAEEHAKVIDAFFNGESDFTADQIKLLNEFFFKQ